MRRSTASSIGDRARTLAGAGLLAATVGAVACGGGEPTSAAASAEPGPPASAAPAPSASAARTVETSPADPPTMRAVPAHEAERAREKTLEDGARLFTVPGAVLLATWNRVGRVGPDGITWIGAIDAPHGGLGRGIIDWVGGSYPDAVDVTWAYENGRAMQPTYTPLTGKGVPITFAPGGGIAWLRGAARIGETVLVSGYDGRGGQRVHIGRGPATSRLSVPWGLRCDASKRHAYGGDHEAARRAPAVVPIAYAASRAGTLFSFGLHCNETPAVEVWPKEGGLPRIIELGSGLDPRRHELLAGAGDDMWILSDPILAWNGEGFAPLPKPPRPATVTFASTKGELHVADGAALHRWDGTRFVEVARLAWPSDFHDLALDEGTLWAMLGGKLHRLEAGAATPTDADCKTPLVYLYRVAPNNGAGFTFPATRKALRSFAALDGVTLVDFEAGGRRLGAVVPSWEVGVRLAAHVENTMKDEHPRVVCFDPRGARVVPIQGAE
jgi:hypothetical protein